MSEKNKWALPSGAREQIRRKGRQMGVRTYRSFDRVDDFT